MLQFNVMEEIRSYANNRSSQQIHPKQKSNQNRLPKQTKMASPSVLNNQSLSKFYPNHQAKSILGSSPSKPQAN